MVDVLRGNNTGSQACERTLAAPERPTSHATKLSYICNNSEQQETITRDATVIIGPALGRPYVLAKSGHSQKNLSGTEKGLPMAWQ